MPATAAGDGQSLDRPFGFFDVHAAPWFGLPSQTPVHGDAAEPTQPRHPPPRRRSGTAATGLPVRIVAEFSWKFQVAAPLALSSVPLAAPWPCATNVFVTHTERPAFEMGSGTPKLQPTSVQSTPAGVDPDVVGPMVHVVPTQPTA